MSKNADSNDSRADETSTSAPPKSEAEFLKRQAEDAQAALKRALEDLKSALAKGVDVRLWAKEHPLATTAIAAAAGFAAAGAAIPSKRQQELKRWIAIERAAKAVDGRHGDNGDGKSKSPPPASPGFLSTLGKEAISALRPVLIALVTSAIAGKEEEPQEQEPPYP